MKKICGVDEAGRGPVIGPMVLAGVLVDEKGEKELKKLGVKDSKLLTKEKRKEFFDKIKEVVIDFKVVKVPTKVVDLALEGNSNLNWLEADNFLTIIDALEPDKVVVDCPSVNINSYKEYLMNKSRKKYDFLVEHKADVNYPVVSAASIMAKVERDKEIEKLKKKVGVNFGSGYMSDEKTRKFLEDNFEKHREIFRESWESYKKVLNSKFQTGLDKY